MPPLPTRPLLEVLFTFRGAAWVALVYQDHGDAIQDVCLHELVVVHDGGRRRLKRRFRACGVWHPSLREVRHVPVAGHATLERPLREAATRALLAAVGPDGLGPDGALPTTAGGAPEGD